MNTKNPKLSHSLFGAVNNTMTKAGMRLLKANILQPSCGRLIVILLKRLNRKIFLFWDLETIQCRLEVVEELKNNEELLFNLKNILSKFLDIENLLSLCIKVYKQEDAREAESKILNTLYLKHTIDLVNPFIDLLKVFKSKLVKTYCEVII